MNQNDYLPLLETCIRLKKPIEEAMNRPTEMLSPSISTKGMLTALKQSVDELVTILPEVYDGQKALLKKDSISAVNQFGVNPCSLCSLFSDLDNLKIVVDMLVTSSLQKCGVQGNASRRIFISHSSRDKKIVDAFVTLLTRGAGLSQSDIFCSSIDGMKIRNGEDIRNHIREDINCSDLVILLVSSNYKQSEICLNEMGAVWATEKTVKAYVFPDLKEESVGWLVNNAAAEKLNDLSALAALYGELQKRYNLPNDLPGWVSQSAVFCDCFK